MEGVRKRKKRKNQEKSQLGQLEISWQKELSSPYYFVPLTSIVEGVFQTILFKSRE